MKSYTIAPTGKLMPNKAFYSKFYYKAFFDSRERCKFSSIWSFVKDGILYNNYKEHIGREISSSL